MCIGAGFPEHLASAAKVAAREVPELAQKFVMPREGRSYLAFRTAARGMAASAQHHREVLVQYGLADTVLDSLTQALDHCDEAVAQGNEPPEVLAPNG